jgi:hypothetical protein
MSFSNFVSDIYAHKYLYIYIYTHIYVSDFFFFPMSILQKYRTSRYTPESLQGMSYLLLLLNALEAIIFMFYFHQTKKFSFSLEKM